MHDSSTPSGSGLTPTQRIVLDLAASGLTNNEIATALGISRNAVRFHLKSIHAILGTGSDRSLLVRVGVAPIRRLLALVPPFLTRQAAGVVAVLGVSLAGMLVVRAAHSRADDHAATSNGSALSTQRNGAFCLGEMAPAPSAGTFVIDERCFATEQAAEDYLRSASQR
jgi:DNA-binding CsgD family transcriptional regulator